jgi:multidrug transporter EmrE-like cation transporter
MEIAPALACALVTQISFLLKQHGARSTTTVVLNRPLHSARALLSSPWFAVGMVVSAVALVLHVAAIADAPLSTVQAVLASGILMLALLGRGLFGWTISRRQWYGIGLTAGGLVLLVATLPTPGGDDVAGPGTLAFVLAMLGVGGLFVAGPRLGALVHFRGGLLGAGAGTLLGVSDVANKALTHVAAGGPVAIVTSPWLIITLSAGVLAFLISGRAFQERDAVPVMACASTAANITAMLGGIAVFGDGLSPDAMLGAVQVLCFALIAGAALLTACGQDGLASRPVLG